MDPPLFSPALGRTLLTRTWIFQMLITGPILLVLGACAFFSVFDGYTRVYRFTFYMGNAILASAGIFIVLVQRQLKPDEFLRTARGKRLTFYFEIAKSVLATALWMWFLLDAIFAHEHYYYYNRAWWLRRIICCAIAYIVLILFWYPTVWYTHYTLKHHSDEDDEEEAPGATAAEGERAPLLGNERA